MVKLVLIKGLDLVPQPFHDLHFMFHRRTFI